MSSFGYYKKRKGDKQWLTKQMKALAHWEVDEAFVEEENGEKELARLLEQLKENDTLVIYKLSVLELKKDDMIKFMMKILSLTVSLVIVEDEIDTREINHSQFIHDSLILMEAETETFKHLTKRRLEIAQENGVILGRPQISDNLIESIRFYRESQKMSIRQIAEKCQVSIGTVHKYITNMSDTDESKVANDKK